MYGVLSTSSLRVALFKGTKCLPVVQNVVGKMSTSSDPQDPSFTQMCEGFFENARSYVEHRLLTKPDPPGYRPEKFDDKKHRIKGELVEDGIYVNRIFFLMAGELASERIELN